MGKYPYVERNGSQIQISHHAALCLSMLFPPHTHTLSQPQVTGPPASRSRSCLTHLLCCTCWCLGISSVEKDPNGPLPLLPEVVGLWKVTGLAIQLWSLATTLKQHGECNSRAPQIQTGLIADGDFQKKKKMLSLVRIE